MYKAAIFLGLAMGLVISILGIMMLINPPDNLGRPDAMVQFDKTGMRVIGAVVLAYGAFRLVNAYFRYKKLQQEKK